MIDSKAIIKISNGVNGEMNLAEALFTPVEISHLPGMLNNKRTWNRNGDCTEESSSLFDF